MIYDAQIGFSRDETLDTILLDIKPDGQFIFYKDKYISEEDMYRDLADFMRMCFKYGNCCKVYDDDKSGNVIVCQYSHDNRFDEQGTAELMWLSSEEVDIINDFRDEKVANAMATETINDTNY